MNKVETAVEGNFHLDSSTLLSDEQKDQLRKRLAGKINSEGSIQVRSQVYRTQLENKKEVIIKMNRLLGDGLKKPKKRIPTKPSKAAKEKRLEEKKNCHSVNKTGRGSAATIFNDLACFKLYHLLFINIAEEIIW